MIFHIYDLTSMFYENHIYIFIGRPDLCIGDRVMVFPWGNCNECNYCRGGCTFCQTMAYGAGPVDTFVYGVWRDGG